MSSAAARVRPEWSFHIRTIYIIRTTPHLIPTLSRHYISLKIFAAMPSLIDHPLYNGRNASIAHYAVRADLKYYGGFVCHLENFTAEISGRVCTRPPLGLIKTLQPG